MLSFIRSSRAKRAMAAAMAAAVMLTVAGCAQKEQAAPQATLVKTMQVIKRDTPIVYDYTGFVQAQQEMELKAQVSGQIMGKYFKGGDTVTAGQQLYSIDQRTYQANLLNAQAGLANARAALANAAMDAERYTKLYEQNAISKQVLDNAIMQRDQAQASVNAQEALVENAQISMTDTSVVAPFTGRIDTTALEVGNYVTAGQTTLATISNTDPVFVQFSVAEPEYLKLSSSQTAEGGAALDNLTIVLSDGSQYDLKGQVAEVNRGINDNTGTLTIKALFDNPQRRLLPGMFAHVQATAGTKEGALLIPKRAVVELMYKKFVYIVGSDNKVTMKEITLGPSVDRLYMVESGLDGSETLVVEGTGKVRQGSEVKPEPMTEAELDTAEQDSAAQK
ncbi:MAG: efflux RND transporter periplasmic adaptor subunit [Phascolarctobacterium sp.]|uniref:efflux RND transporter periplasmic adaptor subunit n=1 Tax=Phascolarctobacterium sp. TaxID=2049039 RepID=UPI0026DB161B|nr:efflux RND transporter periplasmic adaptor subunit [Phascolarctobacterium sp.]MDO4920831.1 efflux RND transporter periplasmic adaptor subunit [Phascolarctobacterium sp.]